MRDPKLISLARDGEDEEGPHGSPKLNRREWEIVLLVVILAKSNKEIAYDLDITTGTVKEYLNRIFTKLGLYNRTRGALNFWWGSQCVTIKSRRGEI